MLQRIIAKTKKIFIPCQENDFRPKILDSNFLVYFLLCLIALKLASLGFLLEFPRSGFFADVSKTVLIQLLNEERRGLGLQELKENPQLERAAMLKAQDILQGGYFSHNSPQGITPWYWFGVVGYNYHYAGENLGIGFLESEEIHKAWNDSPTHKANLLNPNYEEIGIAVLQGRFKGVENTVAVQLFGSQQLLTAALGPEESKAAPTLPQAPQAVVAATKPVEIAQTEIEGIEARGVEVTTSPSWNSGFVATTEEGLKLSFFKFMALNYHNLLQRFIFYSLVAVAGLLLINVFIKFNVQHRDLTLKVLGILFLFALCAYLNKDIMLKFIPHIVNIY